MKGYKAFDKDLKCRGFQYEIGKTYELENGLQMCKNGFHFCETIADCYQYYPQDYETRICEIEALGEIQKSSDKFCTDKIKIIKEITDLEIARCNTGTYNTGYCNSGSHNSGRHNSGQHNNGWYNSGSHNSGSYNSGSHNSGSHNSGSHNSGNYNSGWYNSGSYNSGSYNSGSYNSGDYNSCNHSSGIFNTRENTIRIFDKESEWTYQDWLDSAACGVMGKCPETSFYWVENSEMADEEKERHPEYKIIGGYIRISAVTKKDKQEWWDGLTEDERKAVMALPNFDADKFRKCTGIRVKTEITGDKSV